MTPLHKSSMISAAWLCLAGLLFAGGAHASRPAGTYVGNYIGSDNGTITITVSNTGAVTCDLASAPKQKHFSTPAGGVQNLDPFLFNCQSGAENGYVLGVNGGELGVNVPSDTISGNWVIAYSSVTAGDSGSFTAKLVGAPSTGAANPAALTGLWYDPAYSGSGFNILASGAGLLVTYYGWDANGGRLWLISETGPQTITLGTTITLSMIRGNGGTFPHPARNPTTWGTLSLKFTSCSAATATLNGTDGQQNQNLVLLAGVGGTYACQ